MAHGFSRVITGDGMRVSRFHDYDGTRVDLRGLWFLPRCVLSTIALRMFKYRSVPWLGYRAITHIDSIIDNHSAVLGYGSGMSTLWFARRAARVLSIGTDERWYSTIRRRLEAAEYGHVTYLLSEVALDNSDVPYPEHQQARQTLLEAAGSEADARFFRDFCPGQVSVTEGMLVRFPSS